MPFVASGEREGTEKRGNFYAIRGAKFRNWRKERISSGTKFQSGKYLLGSVHDIIMYTYFVAIKLSRESCYNTMKIIETYCKFQVLNTLKKYVKNIIAFSIYIIKYIAYTI